MNQGILHTIKKNKLERIIVIFTAYLLSQLVLKNQLFALLSVVLLLSGAWLVSRQRAISILSEIQLLFLFFPLIFLYVTGIPKIGPLPLSPVFFFIGLYILYSLLNLRDILFALKQPAGKVFLLMALCWFYQYFISVTFSSGSLLNMQLFELTGIFFGMRFFINGSTEKAIWATRILAGILVISMSWFLVELFYGGPLPIRLAIYHSAIQKYNEKALIGTLIYPNGLSSLLFLFGYQIAISVPLNMMLFFIEKRMSWRIFWAIGSILSLLAMIFAGERSVLLAVSFVLFVFLYKRKQFKAAVLIVFIALFSISISLQVDISRQHLFARLQDEGSRIEATERIKLQVSGLRVAVNNPLGTVFTGKTWSEEAYSSGADFSIWEGQAIAVHNGYIGRVISYGWIFGILMTIVLIRLFRAIRIMFSLKKDGSEEIGYAQIVALSLISVLIQALFHNSSIFTFNGISLTVMFLFLTWVDLLNARNSEVLTCAQKSK